MSPSVLAFHRRRLERMLRDLAFEPGSLVPDFEQALVDDATRRRLTPPLNNQSLAEGLTSAVKIAAALLEARDHA
jgi:hypothetical protein